jgi:hypothetical protein
MVSPELQDKMIEDWKEEADGLIHSVMQQKFTSEAFLFAANNLWFVMVQFAKLIGHRCANKELPRAVFWDYADLEEQAVLNDLAGFLRNKLAPNSPLQGREVHVAQDPSFNLNQFVFENLYPLWKKFCGCYGFEV